MFVLELDYFLRVKLKIRGSIRKTSVKQFVYLWQCLQSEFWYLILNYNSHKYFKLTSLSVTNCRKIYYFCRYIHYLLGHIVISLFEHLKLLPHTHNSSWKQHWHNGNWSTFCVHLTASVQGEWLVVAPLPLVGDHLNTEAEATLAWQWLAGAQWTTHHSLTRGLVPAPVSCLRRPSPAWPGPGHWGRPTSHSGYDRWTEQSWRGEL